MVLKGGTKVVAACLKKVLDTLSLKREEWAVAVEGKGAGGKWRVSSVEA